MNSKSDNFRKYLTKEDLLQESCLKSCERLLTGIPIIHVPNEGKRSDFEAFKFQVLGGKSGPSDLLIPLGSGQWKGLWVELKVGRNKCTPDQMEFLVKMHYLGYAVAVVYDTREDFEFLLSQYQTCPEFFTKGIAHVYGEIKMLSYEEAQAKLVKKVTKATVKRDAEKSFANKAKAKFGKPLKGVKLPNSGKLFKSPAKNTKA